MEPQAADTGPPTDPARHGTGRGKHGPAPSRSRKWMAAGLAAGLIGGGAAGMVLTEAPLSGASTSSTVQDQQSDTAGHRDERRRERLGDVLAPLVEDGTITLEQADAVITALVDAAPDHPRMRRRIHMNMIAVAADTIGVEPRELVEALRDGATVAEVAQDNDVDPATVVDAIVADVSEHLDEAVQDGRLTEEEAAERLATATEKVTDFVNNGPPEGGPGAPDVPPEGADDAEGGD